MDAGIQERVRKIPKAELHCHLDGSVSERLLKQWAAARGEGMAGGIRAPVPCTSLRQYLSCFDAILPFLQEEKALQEAARDVIRQGASENVIYMEVRFAPGLHCKNGLTEAEVCRAVLKGLAEGEKYYGVKSRAILCLMRGKDREYNERTIAAAEEFKGYGVGGIDLAGNEAAYAPGIYRKMFARAEKSGLPFTIHAGECGSAENIRQAVEMGARRIGHGIAAAKDGSVRELCRKEGVCLEMCPTSNLQTKAVEKIEDYPFLSLRREGIITTVHTDNRTVSGTTLTNEWQLLSSAFSQIDDEMVLEANIDAVNSAFINEEEKKRLTAQMRNAPNPLFARI